MLRPRLAATGPAELPALRSRTTTSSSRRPTATASQPSQATPDEPSGIGVVVLPDVRGLYRFYEELALRFAERGFDAVAIDYFGRTRGRGEAGRRLRLHRRTSRRRPRRESRPTSAPRSTIFAARGRARSSPSASASAAVTPGSPPPRDTASRAPSASTANPGERDGVPGRPSARRSWRPDPRAPGRRRPEHHARR